MPSLKLTEADVDLWYVRLDAAADEELLEAYRRLLPEDELAEAARLKSQTHRQRALLARVLARTALSRYTPREPRTWQFVRNQYGKPFVADPAEPLAFNLSHTDGMVVCAVTAGRRVGVDVEAANRPVEHLPLARRFFAAEEAAALERMPPDRRADGFFQFWTLKEAYMKARGLGLTLPLDGFAFALSADGVPQVRFRDDCHDDPACWQFALIRLGARHQVALAVERSPDEPLGIRVRECVPLRREGPARVLAPNPNRPWEIDTKAT
jgi:4'-phosphopantetheinyl transferase